MVADNIERNIDFRSCDSRGEDRNIQKGIYVVLEGTIVAAPGSDCEIHNFGEIESEQGDRYRGRVNREADFDQRIRDFAAVHLSRANSRLGRC